MELDQLFATLKEFRFVWLSMVANKKDNMVKIKESNYIMLDYQLSSLYLYNNTAKIINKNQSIKVYTLQTFISSISTSHYLQLKINKT